jgi:hypothetical protein
LRQRQDARTGLGEEAGCILGNAIGDTDVEAAGVDGPAAAAQGDSGKRLVGAGFPVRPVSAASSVDVRDDKAVSADALVVASVEIFEATVLVASMPAPNQL